MLLPVKSDGSLTWSPSPSDLPADANVSLVAVETDWATSEVQSFPNPFKIIHSADCTAAPTLELPLRTTMGGVDLATVGGWAGVLESQSEMWYLHQITRLESPIGPRFAPSVAQGAWQEHIAYSTVPVTGFKVFREWTEYAGLRPPLRA